MKFRNRFFARMAPGCTPRTRRDFSRETSIRLLVNYGLQLLHAAYYTIFPFSLMKQPARLLGRATSILVLRMDQVKITVSPNS